MKLELPGGWCGCITVLLLAVLLAVLAVITGFVIMVIGLEMIFDGLVRVSTASPLLLLALLGIGALIVLVVTRYIHPKEQWHNFKNQ